MIQYNFGNPYHPYLYAICQPLIFPNLFSFTLLEILYQFLAILLQTTPVDDWETKIMGWKWGKESQYYLGVGPFRHNVLMIVSSCLPDAIVYLGLHNGNWRATFCSVLFHFVPTTKSRVQISRLQIRPKKANGASMPLTFTANIIIIIIVIVIVIVIIVIVIFWLLL